jgi:hypothetical protein
MVNSMRVTLRVSVTIDVRDGLIISKEQMPIAASGAPIQVHETQGIASRRSYDD